MNSDSNRDHRLMDLVSTVLRCHVSERDFFLQQACQNDHDLYREASKILRRKEEMGRFLLDPVMVLKETARPFKIGAVIEERFEIIQEIGEGGMGIVYEALDRKRQLRIAIKAAKPGFQRLLSPELERAIKVSHWNVCRVNEIHTAHTELGEVDFLTMELLDGESLAAYLDGPQKLSASEALEIARQLCAGLAEAHRSGVIHKDLKSANVILCRSATGDVRVVITDFGLAGDVAKPGDFGGTPRYIAPELWLGKKASKASDIYALGVVLRDMATSPATRKNAPPTSFEVLPQTPVMVAPGFSRRWSRTISRCIDPLPEIRPTNALDVLAGLEKQFSLRVSMVGLPLVLLVTLISADVRGWIHDRIWPPLASVRLVVLPAMGSDSTGAAHGVLQDAADRISHLRSGSHAVVVVSPTQAADMQVQTPQEAQRVFHATHALQTTMRREGEALVVSGAIIDLATDAHLKDFSSQYSPQTVGTVPAALTGEVSAGLNLRGGPTEDLSRTATPSYDRGLYFLSARQSIDQAIDSFQEACRLDAQSPLPLARLVEAEVIRFEDTKDAAHLKNAQQYLTKAESLNPDSIRVHMAAGKLSEANGKFAKALQHYLRVRDLEPGRVETLESIAQVYDKLDEPEKAIQEYRTAIALDPTFYEPYEYFGVFSYFRGKYSEAAEQFQKAIERAPGMYRAYLNLAASLENLGRNAEAEQVLLNSLKLRTTADALNNIGTLLASERRDAEAVPYYLQAEEINPNDYVSRLNLGDSYRHIGSKEKSQNEYRRGLDLARAELKENPGSGYVRGFVAYFSARLRDRRRAEDEIGQALQSSPGNSRVILRAVLTYEALGLRSQARVAVSAATPELLKELCGDPDLADFCEDLRYR